MAGLQRRDVFANGVHNVTEADHLEQATDGEHVHESGED